MGKINEGDVMEGIFAIAISLLLSDGRIDKNKLDRIRTQIDTRYFSRTSQRIPIAENVRNLYSQSADDVFSTYLTVCLRSGTAKDYSMVYYSHMKDVGDLDKKTDEIIAQANPFSSPLTRKLLKSKEDFLRNNIGENIIFEIQTDAAENTTVGSGYISGSIAVSIEAKVDDKSRNIFNENISFSIEADKPTEDNMSAYEAMTYVGEAFGLKWKDLAKYYTILGQKASSLPEKQKKSEVIDDMYDEFLRLMGNIRGNVNDKTYNFLAENVIGKASPYIEVSKMVSRDLTPTKFEAMVGSMKLTVIPRGKRIVFADTKTLRTIFEMQMKVEPSKGYKTTFQVEPGTGLKMRLTNNDDKDKKRN